jgi:hypothetical protein
MLKLNIITNKEKRIAFKYIKNLGIKNDGIIFGGMVRDEIVATHYKSLFDDYYETQQHQLQSQRKYYKKFWDVSFHNETSLRTLIPVDVDIFFNNNQSADNFIRDLTEYVELFNGRISVLNSFLYEFGENLIHRKVIIRFYIGKTFSHNGTIIKINIDIIINNNEDVIIEPPFNNADFTCNLFVMCKSQSTDYEIRLSKNTGTKLDQMSFLRKLNLQSKIMNDLIAGNTQFIRKSISNDGEYISGLRILKMMNKNIKISNLLFREVSTTTLDQNCDICQMIIESRENCETFVEILTNKHAINIMHKSCFIKYLNNEIYKKNRNAETNKIECRCTRRNLFNFNESYKYSYVY